MNSGEKWCKMVKNGGGCYYPLSSSFILFHPLSYSFMLFHPMSSSFILFDSNSSSFILFIVFHPFSLAFFLDKKIFHIGVHKHKGGQSQFDQIRIEAEFLTMASRRVFTKKKGIHGKTPGLLLQQQKALS